MGFRVDRVQLIANLTSTVSPDDACLSVVHLVKLEWIAIKTFWNGPEISARES